MDKITTDNLSGYDWYYLEDNGPALGWYVQKTGDEEVSRLSVLNFPNPFDVWEAKIRKSEQRLFRTLTGEERETLKPRQYIFDLQSHRESLSA